MSNNRAANNSLRKTTADDVDIIVSGLETGETLDSLISDATRLLSLKNQHEGNLNQAALTLWKFQSNYGQSRDRNPSR